MIAGLALAVLLSAPASGPRQAQALVREAQALMATDAPAAVRAAGQALLASAEFVPTDFVSAGRKGEVVEDAFREAREAYRRHRAGIYRVQGEALLAAGQPQAAARHLARAELLDPSAGAWPALLGARLAAGQSDAALALLLGHARDTLPESSRALAERVADAAGLASLQAELDRARLQALPVGRRPQLLASPAAAPERARLSTGAPFRLDQPGLTLVYVAPSDCASCSSDLLALQRLAPQGATVYVAAEDDSRDQALRQALRAYRYDWPVVIGARLPAQLAFEAPAVLAVTRAGFTAVVLGSPFEQSLPAVLAVLSREDVQERVPRAAWNRLPARRTLPAAPPGLTSEGLAPGEDEPEPQAFTAVRQAFKAGKYAEALRLLDALPQLDGWLLPPEARFDRALCLAALGRRDEARRLLLRIGDSRFQEAVDQALERIAAAL